jgi:mycofactocin precursor
MPDEPAQSAEQAEPTVEETVVEDVLVEEVSIDGMCGVY